MALVRAFPASFPCFSSKSARQHLHTKLFKRVALRPQHDTSTPINVSTATPVSTLSAPVHLSWFCDESTGLVCCLTDVVMDCRCTHEVDGQGHTYTVPLPSKEAGIARDPAKDILGCIARQSSHPSGILSSHLCGPFCQLSACFTSFLPYIF